MVKNPSFYVGMIAVLFGGLGLGFGKTISLGKSDGPVRLISKTANAQEYWGYIAFYLILGVLLVALAASDRS